MRETRTVKPEVDSLEFEIWSLELVISIILSLLPLIFK